MSDRDEFAKAAMNGFASNMGAGKHYNLDLVAKQAYEIADAMLRAREVPHKTMEQIAEEYLHLKREKDHIADVSKMVLTDEERTALERAEFVCEQAGLEQSAVVLHRLRGRHS